MSMVEFDDTEYQFSHGRKPSGYGSWAFSEHKNQRDPLWAPSGLYLREAKAWARRKMQEKYGKQCRGTLYICT